VTGGSPSRTNSPDCSFRGARAAPVAVAAAGERPDGTGPPIDSHVYRPTFAAHDGRDCMRCEEIMKRSVECVTAKDSVQLAARKMRDENIGFLPVCEDGSKVIGTITDRDIAIRACADDRPASKTKIGDVMTREVIGCQPSDDIAKAQELMSQHHKSRMLCIDEAGKLVGVLSLSDIAQHQAEAGGKTLRDVTSREARV
jgi:CBS domain-containing protein